MDPLAVSDASLPAEMLTGKQVTFEATSHTVPLVGTWDPSTFGAYLTKMAIRAGYVTPDGSPDWPRLSRESNVGESLLSRWRNGRTQPSRQSLDKLARVLGIKAGALYIQAGVIDQDAVDLPERPDLDTYPVWFAQLMETYDSASPADREFLTRSVEMLVDDVTRRRSTEVVRPIRHRRTG